MVLLLCSAQRKRQDTRSLYQGLAACCLAFHRSTKFIRAFSVTFAEQQPTAIERPAGDCRA